MRQNNKVRENNGRMSDLLHDGEYSIWRTTGDTYKAAAAAH
ncbi:hypothetical protein [Domibacillus mangrovi]|nr:hypothetical protein [Domibacillus mangrovi]